MLAVPYSVDLSLTNDCNMNCIHCNLSSGNPKIDEMSTSEVKNLIKELYNLGVFSIAITGGEPLLRKDCFEIIEFALSFNGLRVILNTNGTLFRKRQIRYIANNLKNLELAISMDGSNDREYNSLRMNKNNNNYSNFKIVLHNIEYFKFLDFNNISLNFVVSKRNIDFYKNVVLLAEKLKLKGVLAIKFFQHGRGKLYSYDLELDYTIWENFLISVLEDNKNCKSKINQSVLVSCPWEIYLPILKRGYSIDDAKHYLGYTSPLQIKSYSKIRDVGCNAGITSCFIGPTGTLFPCGTVANELNEFESISIRGQSFKEVWFSRNTFRQLRAIRFSEIEGDCCYCNIKSLCGGGCLLRSYSMKGKFGIADPLCPISGTKGGEAL